MASKITPDQVFVKTLKYGYFPERLMRIFSAEALGDLILNNMSLINTCDADKEKFNVQKVTLTKNDNIGRVFGIPHPIPYISLCGHIKSYWLDISKDIGDFEDDERISMIIPKPNNKNHRLFSLQSYDRDLNEKVKILNKKIGNKIVVKIDISNCYGSIYSHSVPWALVGVPTSKSTIGKSTWYNKYDKLIRRISYDETAGIPIGPDTSAITAEVILAAVDKELTQYEYMRYIDDYTCYCLSFEEAEKFIKDASKELEKYKLKINHHKTFIKPLPTPLDENWVIDLRRYGRSQVPAGPLSKYHSNIITDFIDKALDYQLQFPSSSPLRYAIKVITNKEIFDKHAFQLILQYLCKLCAHYTYLTDLLFDFIENNRKFHRNPEVRNLIEQACENIIRQNLYYRRFDAVYWIYYLCYKFRFKIKSHNEFKKELLNELDSTGILLSYIYSKKMRRVTSDYDKYFSFLISHNNEDTSWLFVYEYCLREGPLALARLTKYSAFYSNLILNGISFIRD